MDIFEVKGRCIGCHYGVSLSDDKFHALNVPENPAYRDDPRYVTTMRFVAKVYHYPEYRDLKEDPGRYLITKERKDWKAFRTPTLYDIAKTGPYMHNGVFSTIEEVIDFFDRGGGEGNSVLKPLGLSVDEKRYLKTFLVEALSGEDKPFKYPVVP
jgi:cytochrome c peroxidase